MSQENVETVREIHRRWNAGESSRELIEDDLEYINPPDAIETGTRRGRASLARIRDVYPDWSFEVERLVDAGDEVVVTGIARGTSLSGASIETRQGYVWTLADGRAVRFRWFRDPAAAFAAAGVAEQ
jgi:ketosteroid isomerase-like protein